MLWRNNSLYGDVTAANQFVLEAGGDRGYTLWQVLAETPAIWRSLFGVFGWFNVVPPDWLLWLWSGLALLALAGAIWAWTKHKARLRENGLLPYLLAGWVVLVYAGMVAFMLQTKAAQGRLLFPALLPMALGISYGLSQWLEAVQKRARRAITVIVVGIPVVSTIFAILFVIRPIYALPEISVEIPSNVPLLNQNLGFGVDLVAADVITSSAQPGDVVWLDLYWRADAVPDTAPEVVITLFGRENALIGKLQSYHGGGLFPTNLWKSGDLIHSRVGLRVKNEIEAPTVAKINVALVDGGSIDVGLLKIRPNMWIDVDNSPVHLGGEETKIGLFSAEIAPDVVRPGDIVTVTTIWEVIDPPDKDLTTLVHLGDPTQPPLAQGDSIPLSGDYPTRFWGKNEVFQDQYFIHIPNDLSTGNYPIYIGMYDIDFSRLPITVAESADNVIINDTVHIGTIIVEK
jgi:hypothetical protein